MPTPNTYRTIFNQSNIFVSPAGPGISGLGATGAFFNSGNSGLSFIGQLSRVQSADLSISFNRTDINEFGILQRIDSEILTPPTFTLNFSYFVTDGMNENLLGFSAKGLSSFVSGMITKASDSKNYFISYSQPGIDDDGAVPYTSRDVIALGNAFVSNYTLNAAVNQPVRADVTVQSLNIAAYTGASGVSPAVNPATATPITTWYWQLPVGDPVTGANTISIIRPGDITLSFPNAAGFISQITGAFGGPIQSFTLSVPISREKIQALGSPFGVSDEITFPVNCTLSVQGLQTNLQPNSFASLLCNDQPYDLQVTMRQPGCNGTGLNAVILNVNQAFLTDQSISQTIGGNYSLSLSYSAQLAGALSRNGVTFSGFYQ